jgi:hypothetical protein
VSLHLTEWSEHDPGRTGAHIYISVSDADAVYAEWASSGVEARVGEPFDTAYGLREFAYVDPTAPCIASDRHSPADPAGLARRGLPPTSPISVGVALTQVQSGPCAEEGQNPGRGRALRGGATS